MSAGAGPLVNLHAGGAPCAAPGLRRALPPGAMSILMILRWGWQQHPLDVAEKRKRPSLDDRGGKRGIWGRRAGRPALLQLGRRPPRPSLVSAATLARPVPPRNVTEADLEDPSAVGAGQDRSTGHDAGSRPRVPPAGRQRHATCLADAPTQGGIAGAPIDRMASAQLPPALGATASRPRWQRAAQPPSR